MKSSILVLALSLCVGFLPGASAQTTSEIAKGNCQSCAEVCQKTANYCNTKKGALGVASVLNALKDCISACKVTDEYLNRGSALSVKTAAICEDSCNEVAKVCDQFKTDQQMTSCANECRKTASNLLKVK